jgi:hypothetical protein
MAMRVEIKVKTNAITVAWTAVCVVIAATNAAKVTTEVTPKPCTQPLESTPLGGASVWVVF